MRIFVYGSLRHKQGNSHWMTNAQLLGDFSIDNYQLYSLGHYPGAVPGNGTVHGEVYRIDNATLAELDALRTRGGEYARQLIQTPYGSAWMRIVYQRPVDGLKLKARTGCGTGCNHIRRRHWLETKGFQFCNSSPFASFPSRFQVSVNA